MTATISLHRRNFLFGGASLAALALAGCSTTGQTRPSQVVAQNGVYDVPQQYLEMYGPLPDERFPIPAADISRLDPEFWRQEVADPTGENPGTIVVDTGNRHLYLVAENGRAMRYGVGIGRDGFAWSGRARVQYKREWPTWTPPAEMIVRQPELEPYRRGMEPSLTNPLGARALYLFQNGEDTLYRLHGNGDVHSIGKAVSSGCVRLLQQDIIDLYNRAPSGSPVLVV